MKGVLLVTLILLSPFLGFGADLNVDATKKKNVRIIKPESFQAKQNKKFQKKRFLTKKRAAAPLLHQDSKNGHSPESAGDDLNRFSKQMSSMGEKGGGEQRLLDQVVTSSEAFEKAYREALTVELSKRAASQVEVRKTNAKLKQGDINRDAKVRRSNKEGFKVQQAGSDGE